MSLLGDIETEHPPTNGTTPRDTGARGKLKGKTHEQITGPSVFASVRDVDTVSVLDWLGLEHDDKHATCPGCQEPGALICKGGGLKCLHNRCSHVGPPGHPGFRGNVEIVLAVRGGTPLEAAKAIAEKSGIEVPAASGAAGARGAEKSLRRTEDFGPTDYEGLGSEIADLAENGSMSVEPPGASAASVQAIQLRSLEDEIALPDEPIAWLWSERHQFAPGRPAIVAGYGGKGKTWLVLEAALSVGTGIPFLGTRPARQGRAIILSYETGRRRLLRRLRRLVHGHGIAGNLGNVQFAGQEDLAVFLTSPGAEQHLSELCVGAQLLVVDALLQGSPNLKENDAEIAGPLHMLGRVSARTDCAVIVIHHERKTSEDNSGADPGQKLRGHSALHAAADAIWSLSPMASGKVALRSTKEADTRKPRGWDIAITDVAGGGIVVASQDAPEESSGQDVDDVRAAVLAYVAENGPGASKNALQRRLGRNRGAVFAAIDELTAEGNEVIQKGCRSGSGGG